MTADVKNLAPVFDLDAYEAPAKETVGPFAFKLNDHTFYVADPRDTLDWKETSAIQHPATLFRQCLSDEDYDKFVEADLSTRKFGELLKRWMRHMGIDADPSGNPLF